MIQVKHRTLAALATGFSIFLAGGSARAATLNVTTNGDSGTGTLRQAIINAASGDTITFFAGSQTIRQITLSSPLVIGKNLTLQGPGARVLTLTTSGGNNVRALEISSGATVNLSGLRLYQSRFQFSPTPTNGVLRGGAVLNSGTLSVSACNFESNAIFASSGASAQSTGGAATSGEIGRGGAIYNAGSLRVDASLFRGNTARGGSGGNGASGAANGSGASGEGGAVYNAGSATLVNCTFSGNSAAGGSPGSDFSNSSIGAAGDARGGAVANAPGATIVVAHCTLAGNAVEGGAGEFNATRAYGQARGGGLDIEGAGSATLADSIVAGNFFATPSNVFTAAPANTQRGPDVNGTSNGQAAGAASGDFNLLSDGSGAFLPGNRNKYGAAMIGPLRNNGGPVDTILPAPTSPAIDAGLSNVLTPASDGRGRRRLVDYPGVSASAGSDNLDIGAVEVGDPASSLIVTTNSDASDDLGGTTLRSAMDYANFTDGAQTIAFNLPASLATGNVWVFKPGRALPILTDAGTTIDGSTQTAIENRNPVGPEIVLDGLTNTGTAVTAGIEFGADNCTVRGLNVRDFRGLQIRTSSFPPAGESYDGCAIYACYLGCDETGTVIATRGDSVQLQGLGHRVGAPDGAMGAAQNGNLIAGVSFAAVYVGSTAGGNCLVQNNIIGLNRTATATLARAGATDSSGVLVLGTGNLVGGAGAGEGNTICGVFIGVGGSGQSADLTTETALLRDNRVQNNLIGTSAAGAAGLGCNDGVLFQGALGTIISDNRIANCGAGVVLSAFGTAAGDPNPGYSPIRNSQVTGNIISNAGALTPYSGARPHGVQIDGTSYLATGNIVSGGSISGSSGAGVSVTGAGATGNRISAVRMGGNAGGDIDLGGDGVTPNDAGDGDTGPNLLQNFPVLRGASGPSINGTLNSMPNGTYRIEFFSKPATNPAPADPRGTYLGSVNASTNASGEASFSFQNAGALDAGTLVVATATDAGGNTSENSAPATVAPVSALSGAIISEFRFRGKAGAADEYVELLNKQNAPLDISGWSLQTRTASGLQTTTIPAGTTIPVFGHFLFTGSTYSLSGYGTSNASIAGDMLDNSGAALLNAAGAVQDAVGFTSSDAALREGAGLPNYPTVDGEYAFMRDFIVSQSKDTSDSTNDFVFVSTTGAAVAGTPANVAAQLGAPSPEGLSSPAYFNNQTLTTLLDTTVAAGSSPNRVRVRDTGLGFLVVRRTIKNNSLVPIKQLRFSVTAISSLGSAGDTGAGSGQADVRLTSQPAETGVMLANGTLVNVEGTTLEAGTGQPQQPLGGGLGSSLDNGTVTLSTPLAPGMTRNYAFRLQIVRLGNYFIALNILALPQ